MCGKRNQSTEQPEGTLRQVKWTLISAMPYPVTGETVNIGIVYRDEQGRRRVLKGAYQDRLKAFAPEPAIHLVIENEICQLQDSIERTGKAEDTRHLIQAEKTTLVHSGNSSWMHQILKQMVPGRVSGSK